LPASVSVPFWVPVSAYLLREVLYLFLFLTM
jgi:hypothetical protein